MVVTHIFAPGRTGGLERVVEMLAIGHAARGHRVEAIGIVAGDADEAPVMRRLAAGGVSVTTLRVAGRAYRAERRDIARVLAPRERGVVHTHGYRADVLHAPAARALGFGTLTTLHGFAGGDLKNRFYEHVQRRWCRSMDRVVAVSRPIFDQMQRSGIDAAKLRLIPNAYSIAEHQRPRDEARRMLGLPIEGLVVGWVGRLSREKGADVFLHALAQLRDLPLQAVIVGEGPEGERLRTLSAELGVEHQLHWAGAVDGMSARFSALDALVLSSRTEGTPIVLFEAMAARVPIVTTAVGGIPDVLTAGEAILVAPEAPAALAAGIRALVQGPDDAACRAAAAADVLRQRFNPSAWLDRYESVYAEALTALGGERSRGTPR